MSHVEAIFRGGVFQPLGRVDLRENQRVRISFQAADTESVEGWVQEVARLHRPVVERIGTLPDSAPDRRR